MTKRFVKKKRQKDVFLFYKKTKKVMHKLTIYMLVFLFVLTSSPGTVLAVEPDFTYEKTSVSNILHLETESTTGSFLYDYPIEVPPGRNGLQPDLNLSYNSQLSRLDNFFGEGWSINIPYIERINREGVEDLYSEDYFYSSLNGELKYTGEGEVAMLGGGVSSSVITGTSQFLADKTEKTESLYEKVVNLIDEKNDNINKENILAEYQIKVDKKSKVLESSIIDDVRCDEEMNCVNYGQIRKYLYISDKKLEKEKATKNGDEYKEVKRTKSAIILKETTGKTNAKGESLYMAKFYVGEPFYEDNNGDYYQTEYATTTIEAYNEQMDDNALGKVISFLRGEKAQADSGTYYSNA